MIDLIQLDVITVTAKILASYNFDFDISGHDSDLDLILGTEVCHL